MARTLKREQSLSRKRQAFASEERILAVVRVVEWVVALTLILVGTVYYLRRGSPALLFAGGMAGFLAIGHHIKILENRFERVLIEAGLAGEENMASLLEQKLDDSMFILNDVQIDFGKQTAQIDHLVISPKGIFVVETKNWAGRVAGDAREPLWRHYHSGDQHPRKLKNPIRQNRRQAGMLYDALNAAGISWPDILPVVVMSSPRTKLEITGDATVLKPQEVVNYINHFRADRLHDEGQIQKVLMHLTDSHA